MIRSYLDTCLDLPWHTITEDDLDQARARKVLDRDHYGLQKVKERILETAGRAQAAPDVKGADHLPGRPSGCRQDQHCPLHCRMHGRKYVRMSLGGVRDEAEIRGHRRTYIGAMPGRSSAP